jgi:hypothetical protein
MTDVPGSFEEIVARYRAKHHEKNSRELRLFATRKSLEDAVRLAALARTPLGKKLKHQRRIPNQILANSANNLLANLHVLRAAVTFEELYDRVEELILPIDGIADLTVYDTALRIAAYLGKEPVRVYLHAGTRRGAAHLGLGYAWLDPGELPAAFRMLKPWEIEDCLCIYENEIATVVRNDGQGS